MVSIYMHFLKVFIMYFWKQYSQHTTTQGKCSADIINTRPGQETTVQGWFQVVSRTPES